MTSPIVRGLLGACFVLFVVTTFHCTIDHIPHVYCNVSSDCDPPQICDQAHHTCYDADGGMSNSDMPELAGPDMFCTSSAECSDDAPICSVQRCRACMDSGDDPQCLAHNPMTPRCNAPTGKCVQCLASTDCMNPTPVCNTTAFTCRKCVAHSECPSQICSDTGSCVDAGDIAYVNNSSGACMDTVHASTPQMPYCTIQYAASNSSKQYVLVSASATPYGMLSFAPTTTAIGPLTIVGPAGRNGAPTAVVASSVATAAITLSTTTSAALTITFDGLQITGAGGATPSAAVNCQGSMSTVTIKNSTVVNSGKEGVNSSGCTLTLDGNIISGNGNEGVKLATTTYVITNNIIDHNGAAASGGLPGVTIADSGSTGTFAFNTVANNGGTNTLEGGISCPNNGAVKIIENSIVAQNTHNPATNGTQLIGKCQLMNVVTGPDSFTGAIQSPPAFVSGTDFHLDIGGGLAANQTCCIDKVPSATTPNADHDVDRDSRPKGNALDTGADEAK